MDPDRWKRVEPILDTVLDLPGDQRGPYLDRACGEDGALRAAVDALLSDCENSDGFLEAAGGAALAEVAAASAFDPLAPNRIGSRLGPYRLGQILGQGGMGTVYLAERVDGQYEQKVAIKVANRHDLDREAAERFRFERQLLARLQHPGIARLLDGGVTQDDTPYLIMELVDGRPLDRHCESLPVMESLRLLQEVGRAVAYAHRLQVVHRDLKPSNILVTRSGQVKLLDFGVAELLNPGGDEEPPKATTESSGDRLTLGYAAPELLLGKRVSDACDVYSLGVLLYRLLTGRLPFDARAKPVEEFIHEVVHREALPPSAAGGDRELDAIVLRALAKKPEDRYASVEAFLEDLERHRDGLPVHALPQTLGYRFRKHLLRNRWLWLAAGIATTLLLVASSGWINSRRQAVARAGLAQRFGQEAERIEWFLRHAQALPRHDIRREKHLMKERLQQLQAQIRTLGPLAQGPGNFALGRGYARLNQPQRASQLLEEAWSSGYRTAEVALALGKALGALYDEKRGDALRIRDPDLRAAQVRELETAYRDRALYFLSQAGSPDLESSSALFGLIAFYDGRLEEALRRAREARQEAPWLIEGFRLEGDVHLAKATLAGETGLAGEAQKSFEASLDAYSQALQLAPSDPTLYERVCNGWLLRLNPQRLRASSVQEPTFQSGLESCSLALEVDPESENAWHLISTLFMVRLQDASLAPAQVREWLREAEEAVRRALELNPRHAAAHHTLGTVFLSWALRIELPGGEDPGMSLDRAASAFRRSLELDAGLVKSYANLGTTLAVSAGQIRARGGDPRPAFDEATASFRQALDRAPGKVLLLYNIAVLKRDKAEFESSQGLVPTSSWSEAADYANQALAANPQLTATLNLLGAIEEGLARQAVAMSGDPSGHLDKALRFFDQALEKDPRYFRAAVNQASVGILHARLEAGRDGNPEAPLLKAMAAADRARAIGASTAELVFQQQADSRLLRAELALARGEEAETWLEEAAAFYDEGLAVHPRSAALLVGRSAVQVLRARVDLEGPSREGGCLAQTRSALQEILERDRQDGAAALLLSEALLWCSVSANQPRTQLALRREGFERLQMAGPASLYWPSKEVLAEAFATLAEGDLGSQARQGLDDAIGEDTLLRWRFEPLLGPLLLRPLLLRPLRNPATAPASTGPGP